MAVTKFWLDGLTGHRMDLTAVNAEIGQFAVGQTAQFGNGVAILTPVAEVTYDVHFLVLSVCLMFLVNPVPRFGPGDGSP